MPQSSTILVTGGAGFIGSSLVRLLLGETTAQVVNLDLLTYAGLPDSLADVMDHPRHAFVQGNVGDAEFVGRLLAQHRPQAVLHLAAETHVDRSIDNSDAFAKTNLLGTGVLLRCCLDYWETLPVSEQETFRFVHGSTDEVFGSLAPSEAPFNESSPYRPNSPYAATKAGSDHLVRSYWQTYGLPTIVTNSSNNYGPRQFPEKLIPLMIVKAAAGESLPIYGDGRQVRDWLYVEDQCRALLATLQQAAPGSSYNIGGGCELTNLDVVERICDEVDRHLGNRTVSDSRKLIEHVEDRPGHDRRYAIDASRIRDELGWTPRMTLEMGLRKTVEWYLSNEAWLTAAAKRVERQDRLGLRHSTVKSDEPG